MFSKEVQKEVEAVGDLREYSARANFDCLDLKKDVVKYAFHGIWGSMALPQVLEMYAEKSNAYITQHMVKIREAIRQRKQARVMENQVRHIGINWEKEYGLCGQPKAQALIHTDSCTDNCFTCAHIVN